MRHILQLLLFTLALAFASAAASHAAHGVQATYGQHPAPTKQMLAQKERPDRLTDNGGIRQQSHSAMLSDSQSRYRLSTARPTRLLPPSTARYQHSPYRLPLSLKHKNNPQRFFGGRYRLETSPFQTAASCDYYVYALRHLIC